ncbi:hypothetical protein DFQ28_008176 [Apophysomyces sp. BC1034]|nr:hypothetical protein DFQ30_007890 [Apophysomyces sp. BC1015]KAG0186203.1 hypothetical protein DFQ28_008176 [Apophysomyces sp. BC1034]
MDEVKVTSYWKWRMYYLILHIVCENIQEQDSMLRSLDVIDQATSTGASTITVDSVEEADDDDDDTTTETVVRKDDEDALVYNGDTILEHCLDTHCLYPMINNKKKQSLKLRFRNALKISTRTGTPPTPPLTPCRSPSTPFPSQNRPSCTEQKYQPMTPLSLTKAYPKSATAYAPQLNTKTICATNDEWTASSSVSSCSSTLSAASFSTASNSCVSSATSHTAAYNSCSFPSVASPPPPLATPDIQPFPSSSSRFLSALHKLKSKNSNPVSARKNINSVVPDASQSRSAAKLAPTKSSTLADRIKSKFQLDTKKNSTARMPRSTSLSSLAPSMSRFTKEPRRKSTATTVRSIQSRNSVKSILREPQPLKHRDGSNEDLRPLFHLQQEQRKRIAQHKKQSVRFAKAVTVRETFSKQDYDRSSDPQAVCTHLTATLAQRIKEELNHYKLQEMHVHQHSRVHTHFFL